MHDDGRIGVWGASRSCLQREALVPPVFKTAGKRSDQADAFTPEKQRHTGAGGFVGSGAIKDHFAFGRNVQRVVSQGFGVQVNGAGNLDVVGVKFIGMAKIHHHHILARRQFAVQFLRRNAGHA